MFLLVTWMSEWSARSASSQAERNCSGASVFDILEGTSPSEGPQQAEKEHHEIQQKQMGSPTSGME